VSSFETTHLDATGSAFLKAGRNPKRNKFESLAGHFLPETNSFAPEK